MRTIKFRAWDKKNKYYKSWLDLLTETVECSAYCNRPLEINVFEATAIYDFQQFTGLHDKNGTEIYEGDIVKFENLDFTPENGLSPYSVGEVMWQKEWVRFVIKGSDDIDENDFEVIGNIYENPELLSN